MGGIPGNRKHRVRNRWECREERGSIHTRQSPGTGMLLVIGTIERDVLNGRVRKDLKPDPKK